MEYNTVCANKPRGIVQSTSLICDIRVHLEAILAGQITTEYYLLRLSPHTFRLFILAGLLTHLIIRSWAEFYGFKLK